MRSVVGLVALFAALLPSGLAVGQVRHPTYAEVERSEVEPEAVIAVAGGGWQPGGRVEMEIAGRDVGDAGVGERGFFDTAIRVPDLPEGRYVLAVSGTSDKGEPFTVRLTMDVTGGLTPTGWLAIAVGAVVVLVVIALLGMVMLRRRAYRTAER